MERKLREPVFMPFDKISEAGGIVNHIKNRWWIVHPEKGLCFHPYSDKSQRPQNCSPQCNSSRAIIESLRDRLRPEFEVRFFESVLQPIDIQDYAP